MSYSGKRFDVPLKVVVCGDETILPKQKQLRYEFNRYSGVLTLDNVQSMFSCDHPYCKIEDYHIQDAQYASLTNFNSLDIFINQDRYFVINTSQPFYHSFLVYAFRNQGKTSKEAWFQMDVEVCGYEKVTLVNETSVFHLF